jgi:hypothetical protein
LTFGDSLLITDQYDYDALAYQARVIKDGGTVVNFNYVDSCIKHAKTYGYWNSTISWYSANGGVKFTVSGNDSLVDKLYDFKGRYDMIGVTTTRPDLQKNVKNGKYSIKFDSATGNRLVVLSSLINYSQPFTIIELLKSHPSNYAVAQRQTFSSNSANTLTMIKGSTLNSIYRNYLGTYYNYTLTNNTWYSITSMCSSATSKLLINNGSVSTGLNFGANKLLSDFYISYTSINTCWASYFTELIIMQGDQATNAKNYIHPFLNQRYNIY